MTDQISTPGSTADTSVNGGKAGASKDKQCPFCAQSFTSSSLGRHLDLYIKEKNPKPADGIHHVDEIRKLRGGITRRQPRNSSLRREDSTPAGTPGPPGRSPPESEAAGHISPALPRYPSEMASYNDGKAKWVVNKGTWESTGVMNHIPAPRNGDSGRSWEVDDGDPSRRVYNKNRSVSKQILAKSTFEQKQKLLEAQDRARAAELALRELMAGIRAAKQRIDGPNILDYDPLTFDFPSLVLHCLSPPPTLYQSHPLPTLSSWSISPPDDQQYEALRQHFHGELHRWRASCAVANTMPRDDLSYPPRSTFNQEDDPAEVAERAVAAASDLQDKIANHLHEIYKHWTSLSPQARSELWTLELARSVGRKSANLVSLKAEKDLAQQEAAHLRMQVDELSRLQHPREFRLGRPKTIPIDSQLMSELVTSSLDRGGTFTGFNLSDRSLHIDDMVERVIGRWNGVVKESRIGQRSLSGDSQPPLSAPPKPVDHSRSMSMSQNQSHRLNIVEHGQSIGQSHAPSTTTTTTTNNNIIMNGTADMSSDPDADADADADMEEDDSFVEMANTGAPQHQHQKAPNAPMTQAAANFRLTNGNMNGTSAMTGVLSHHQNAAAGYSRIGV